MQFECNHLSAAWLAQFFIFPGLAGRWSPAKRQILKQQDRLRRRRRRWSLDGTLLPRQSITGPRRKRNQTNSIYGNLHAALADSFMKNDNCCGCCHSDVAACWRHSNVKKRARQCLLPPRPSYNLYTFFILVATWFMAVAHLAPYRCTGISGHQQPATNHLQQQLPQRFFCVFFGLFSGEQQGQPAAGSSFVSAIAGNEKLPNMPRFALHRHAYVAHNWRLCHKRRNATCPGNCNTNSNSSI